MVGMDVLAVPVSAEIPSGYEIVIHGGRKRMGMDAIAWARRCQELGAGELCVNALMPTEPRTATSSSSPAPLLTPCPSLSLPLAALASRAICSRP